MRYVYLAAAACLFVLGPSVAAAQRVPFKDGEFTKDGSNNLVCEVDAATADGIEFKFTPQGDLYMTRSGGFGSTTAASASCITRDSGTDQLYGDKDCDQVKDAGEEFLDLAGGTGAPTGAEYIVGEANASLSAEVAPSAANQVPVSSSSSNAAWGTIPTAAISSEAITEPKLDAENVAGNGQILAYNAGTGRLRWDPPDSAVFSPISPPIALSGAHAAGAAAYPMQKGIVTNGLWNHFELNTVTQKENAWVDIWVGNYADAVTECDSGASVGRFFRLLNANDCNGTGGIAGATCECRAISPSTYALASTVSVGDRYLWASTVDGSALGAFYDHTVVDWQDPWLKLEAATPGDCFSTVMVQKGNSGDFSLAWNPGSTVQTIQDITLSDEPGITNAESELQATIAFSGWIDRDPDEWGTTHYLNPLATTPETVFQNAGNVMGVMWWKNKFYQVWRRVGTTTISVLEDLTDNFKLTPACGGSITPPATYSFCQRRHIMTFSLYNAWGGTGDNPFMRAASTPGLTPAAGASWNAPDEPDPATGTPLHNTQATRAMTVCNQKFYTLATLPACTAGYANVKIAVNNAEDANDCNPSGTGSTVNTCNCNGTSWVDSGGSPPNAEGFFSRHYAVQGYIGN